MKGGRFWMLMFLIMAALVMTGAFTRQTEAATFIDNFSSGINTDHWTVTNGLYTIDDTQGDIRISKGVGGTGAPGEWARIEFKHTVYGDFDVSVEYSGAVLGGCQNQVQLNLTFGGQHVCNRRENWCGSRYSVWLDPPASTVGATGTSDTSGILRVTRVGTTVTFYANATQIYQANFNNLPVTYLSLSLQNNGTSDAISVIFDNFSLTADSIEGVCTPPPSDMVSWWPGDNSAIDIQGDVNGTLIGDTTYNMGMVGRAFDLDGDGDSVFLGNNTVDLANKSFSIEMWAKRKSTGVHQILLAQSQPGSSPPPNTALHVGFRVNRFTFAFYWNDLNTGDIAGDTLWHHWAVTYDATTNSRKIYKDGNLVGNDTASADYVGTGELYLGQSPWWGYQWGYANALIDEVSIYNRTLSQAEIQAIYNAGAAGKCKPSCVTAPSDMVSWWKAEDNANDSYGTNHGTMMNGATFAAGKVGQAFSFDGVDDYIQVPDSISLDITNQITIDAWIKPWALGGRVVDKISVGQTNGYLLDTHDGKVRLIIADQVVYGSTNLPLNEFTHIAGTYDGFQLKVYVNGSLDGTLVAAVSIPVNSLSLRIGGDQEGRSNFYGLIDEVEVYNRALTAEEIAAIYNAGSAGKCPIQKYNLAIAKAGTGSGTVTSNPSGINCGGTCNADFNEGTDVTLTAAADASSTFAGWGGDCSSCGANTTCDITMDAAKTCTATFTLNQYTITATANPVAGGSVSCSPNPVNHGSTSTCTITTNAGYTFQNVTGTCGGTLNGNTYTTNAITTACTVQANFNLNNNVVIASATGTGNITLQTNSPNCGFYDVSVKTEAQVGNDPQYDYPHGLVEFTLNCMSADVTITFPNDVSSLPYRKYGPMTPGNPGTSQWYEFTNVTKAGNQVTLHLEDGQIGDDTGTDGVIVDQGGPGQPQQQPVAVPTMTEWGMMVFMLLAGLGAMYYLKRQRAER